jgi:hypothetical protein
VDSEVLIILSRAYAFCEEEGHVIMDVLLCLFTSKHVHRHVELQNVEGTLMDQPHEHELGIHVV